MGFQDFLRKVFKKDEDFKQAEHEMRIQKKLIERQKSANERELEKYMEEERQERIKRHLEAYRKKQQRDLWTANLLKQKNIFKGHKNILAHEHLFDFEADNLKGGNMFMK